MDRVTACGDNPTGSFFCNVFVNVKNDVIGIEETSLADIEQYRTDSIGDALKVSQIAQIVQCRTGHPECRDSPSTNTFGEVSGLWIR